MIPSSITAEHVRQAAKEALRKGVPAKRESTKFVVEIDGKPFPPKYLVSLACRFATGQELDPSEFSGGEGETNAFLHRLGFRTVAKHWGEDECYLAVWAYDQMDQGLVSNRKQLYREIAEVTGRTAGSVEFKVQNVSACDPRPRRQKPIGEKHHSQTDLRKVFNSYWKDRVAARTRYAEVVARLKGGDSILAPWDAAIGRIERFRQAATYMPIAVLAAVRLIEEGLASPTEVLFKTLERRFDELQQDIGDGKTGMAWEPFVHLASRADVWLLIGTR